MKIEYKIFKLEYSNGYTVPTLIPFDHWNDTFDTKEECMCQIKECGYKFNTYTIMEHITFE